MDCFPAWVTCTEAIFLRRRCWWIFQRPQEATPRTPWLCFLCQHNLQSVLSRIHFFSQPASMYLINCKEWFFLIILYRRLDKRIMSGPYFSFHPLAEKTFCICHNQPSKVFRTMTDFVHAQRETGGSICLLARMALRVLILRDVTNSIFLMQLKRPSSMFLPPEGTCQPHKNVWIFQTVMRTVKQTNKQAELQTMEILKRTLNYGMGPETRCKGSLPWTNCPQLFWLM